MIQWIYKNIEFQEIVKMKEIKKTLAFLLCFFILITALISCNNNTPTQNKETTVQNSHTYDKTVPQKNDGSSELVPTEGLKYTLIQDTYYEVSAGTAIDATEIVIPSIYEGKAVAQIARQAFLDCENVTKIIIPKTITHIESYAFSDCKSLSNIVVDPENPLFKSIDGNLYSKNGTGLLQYARGKSATEFTTPTSVTSIASYAFAPSNLTKITIGNTVTEIGDYAFFHSESLVDIVIGKSVTSIGPNSFSACYALKNIYFAGSEAEWNAIGTSHADIPESVTIHFNYNS